VRTNNHHHICVSRDSQSGSTITTLRLRVHLRGRFIVDRNGVSKVTLRIQREWPRAREEVVTIMTMTKKKRL